MAPKTKTPRAPMSDAHKQALAEGREQGRAVRQYLEALEAHKPKRGRKRTPDSIRKRLATIEERVGSADPLSRLQLVEERMDLQRELEAGPQKVDLSALEKAVRRKHRHRPIVAGVLALEMIDRAPQDRAALGGTRQR